MGKLSLYLCDVETTNINPDKGDIIEISFLREFDGQQRTWFIKPTAPENIEDTALKINGADKEDLLWHTEAGRKKYRLLEEVLPEIENWIADDNSNVYDRLLVGHNINYDYLAIKHSWAIANCKDSFPFSYYGPLIDTKCLALFYDWMRGENNEKYNMGACIKKFGLEKRKLHSAEQDTRSVYDLIMFFAKEFGK